MKKKSSVSKSNKTSTKNEIKDKKETLPSILSMGLIDLTFKIEFSDEDLEIKDENEENKTDNKSYYDINDFHSLKDLQFLKDRKKVWDKFELIPNNPTLEHLLFANYLRKKKIITEYIGFGRPCFTKEEEFFENIFEYISKKNNILFNTTPLDKTLECHLKFEFKHKKKYNNFEIERSSENSNENKEEEDKHNNKNKPTFSRDYSFFINMNPQNSKYNLFYLNYQDLYDVENFQKIDLVELIYFLKKRGVKIFINFYKNEEIKKEEETGREQDISITPEHFLSKSKANTEEEEEENEDEDEDEDLDDDEKSKKMKDINNIYYYTDLYFFDTKQAPKKFNKHYKFFTADKIKTTVNKGNLYDYFIKGIATGTKDEVENEKYGFFIDYFNKLYIIKADKTIGNKYEFDLKIYPQINHYNMEIIKQYKQIIKYNKNYYISLILAFILSSIIENNSTDIEALFKGYLVGLEVIKKKIELERHNINIKDNDYMNVNISNNDINIKIKTLEITGQENGFILDCTNKEKSELKDYVPLYDTHMINYLKNSKNQNELIKKGFINDKGFIMVDQQYRNIMKDDAQAIIYNKKEFSKNVKDKINDINVLHQASDRFKDPRKEALNMNMPTKKKIPNGKLGAGTIYNISASNNKSTKKNSKNITNNNKKKNIQKNEKINQQKKEEEKKVE